MKWFVGAYNSLATNALERYNFLDNPGVTLIYGLVGTGKTTMLKKCYQHMNDKLSRVVMLEAEDFSRQYVEALQTGSITQFRAYYRNLELLIIDHIENWRGKVRTIEEFFYTYEYLSSQGGKLILAIEAEMPRLDFLGAKLASRILSGLIIPVSRPSTEELEEILMCLVHEKRLVINHEVIHNIAGHARTIAEAKDLISEFVNYAEDNSQDLGLECFEKFWVEHSIRKNKIITPINILNLTAKITGTSVENILGSKRSAEIMQARQISIFAIRYFCGCSFPELGHLFKREHGTIIHAYKQLETKLKSEANLQAILREIAQYFGNEFEG